MFEPPRGTHYFVGAGVGPVTVDELMADHHIEVVNLAGRGGDETGELRRAFEAVTTACQVAPEDDAAAALAEKLAAATGGWADLVAEASGIATEATDPKIASKWWARLGSWYYNRLDRPDYGVPSLR